MKTSPVDILRGIRAAVGLDELADLEKSLNEIKPRLSDKSYEYLYNQLQEKLISIFE